MNLDFLNKVLGAAVTNGASDIHLKVGRPPMYRIDGSLKEIKAPKLTAPDTDTLVEAMLKIHNPDVDVAQIKEYDTSYSVEGVARFRLNVFRQKGSLAAILRVIPVEIPTIESLKLPHVLKKIADFRRGLVLVTGVTGSGKSSTLAALINQINEQRNDHILTLEDPIEFVHQDKKASVSQREIGQDSKDFGAALRGALRQDPDVILVGEMRDYETVDIALKAAETGHLVLSTVHTTDAPMTINRLIGVFPADQQEGVRMRLAENLKASISQRLLTKLDGKGRIAALEIMISTLSIQECIKDPNKTTEMHDFIARGRDDVGSMTFDQALTTLYKKKVVSLEVAKAAASNPSNFERALNYE